MGLDTVELVIRFEDAFGITIPDHVATELTTPRKVTEYVVSQLPMTAEPSCLSQQAFYFLRRRLLDSTNINRTLLKPDTRLQNIIPVEHRRLAWMRLRSEIGSSAALPDLARPLWLVCVLSLITAFAFNYAAMRAPREHMILFGLAAAVLVGCLGSFVTRPLKRYFRRGYESVGAVAIYLSLHNPNSFKREGKGWTREQVSCLVREIIIEEVGTKDFTEDSHFIHDMHLD